MSDTQGIWEVHESFFYPFFFLMSPWVLQCLLKMYLSRAPQQTVGFKAEFPTFFPWEVLREQSHYTPPPPPSPRPLSALYIKKRGK